jgi:hypothetical protein
MDRYKISFDLTNQNGVDLYFVIIDASVVLTSLQASTTVKSPAAPRPYNAPSCLPRSEEDLLRP